MTRKKRKSCIFYYVKTKVLMKVHLICLNNHGKRLRTDFNLDILPELSTNGNLFKVSIMIGG